jgi:hypothetical protein
MQNYVEYVLIALVLVWIVGRQVSGRYVSPGRSAVLPAILIVLGIASAATVTWSGLAVALVAGELVVVAAMGVLRGSLTHLTLREGYLYQRGGALGLGLWVVTVGLRVLIELGASAIGVGAAANATIALSFGVSLAVQFVVLSRRVRADGRPLRPGDRGRRPAGDRATLDR